MRPVSARKASASALIALSFLLTVLLFQPLARAGDAHPLSAAARAHIESVLEKLPRGMTIGQIAVSPDGKRLAWVEGTAGGSEILLAPLDDLAKTQTVSAASPGQNCVEGAMTWAPDSRAMAFLSDCASNSGQYDLYLSYLDGQPARRLTNLSGYVHSLQFSPDGKEIGFLYVPGSMRPAGALAAQTPEAGVIGETHIEVQRVAVAQADAAQSAAPSLISPANLHVYEFDWAPDAKAMAYVAADPPGENNWWVAKLYAQRLAHGIEPGGQVGRRVIGEMPPRVILDPSKVAGSLHGLQIAVPRWSPDGKRIAFIGGLMSDQGVTGGDVWIIAVNGGEPRDLTPRRPATPSWITWAGGDRIFMNEIAGGGCRLVRLTLHGGPAVDALTATAGAPVFSFPGSVGDGRMERSLSASADRSLFVFWGSTFDTPGEIYVARPGAVAKTGEAFPGAVQISHFNDGVKPAWGKSVSLAWTDEGFHVQGWLTLPADYDPAKKYPLIVEVHGGPAAAELAHWNAGGMLSPSTFSALGYFLLQPNPRGSFGEGEAFTQANRKDFGYGDLRDILAGVDKVEAKYPIDANRLGITGWSYGGFMSMFAPTQTERFKASVAGAGISNWLSYYGENSIDQWMIPFFGASVYDDPAVYAKSSAINFIKRVRTPTLLVVGDRDGECPAPQSFEYWHALHDLGVPTELVVYPNEGHGFTNPDHEHDVELRTMEWFAKYLPAR